MTRVFGVDYQFLSAGDVFTQGLVHAAESLGVPYAHAEWNDLHLYDGIRTFDPELLLVVHGRRFRQHWPDVFAGIRSAVWLLDEPYEVDETSRWSAQFDHVFVNDPSTLHRHVRASYLPACFDPVVHYANGTIPKFRVGFVGGANPVRELYLSALAHMGLLDYLIGGPWYTPALHRLSQARVVTPVETAALYRQTEIVINVFRDKHHDNREGLPATALNPRIYEAVACGALVVSEWRPELATLAPSIPTFRSVQDCVACVDDFLAHPSLLQARAAACRAELAGHTYAARLETILATMRQPQEVA